MYSESRAKNFHLSIHLRDKQFLAQTTKTLEALILLCTILLVKVMVYFLPDLKEVDKLYKIKYLKTFQI